MWELLLVDNLVNVPLISNDEYSIEHTASVDCSVNFSTLPSTHNSSN